MKKTYLHFSVAAFFGWLLFSENALASGSMKSYNAPEDAVQMIALGMVILAAHLGGKLCIKFNLSEVTGQLLGGALVGPYTLHLMHVLPGAGGGLYDDAIHAAHFFIFVFLGMVAFGIGEELHIRRLRKVGKSAVIICFIQGLFTWILISSAFYFIGGMPLLASLLIGSIGIATAPAVTFVLMNKLNIEGRLRHVLGSVVVLDDLVEVIIFSLLMQASLLAENSSVSQIVKPVARDVALALGIGILIYLSLRILVRRNPALAKKDKTHSKTYENENFLQRVLAEHPSPSAEILLVVMGIVSIGAGAAYYNHLPFLITAAFGGFLIANYHSHAIFDSLKIENITPVFNIAFFAMIGASIDLSYLDSSSIWLVVLYIITRMAGKIGGTWLGCNIVKEERKITACLPSLMLPQAGVAAVEVVYAGKLLGDPTITAIILPAIVFFEVVGVFLVDRGLSRWSSWVEGEEEEMQKKASRQGPQEAAKKLLEFINPSFITLDLKADDKEGIIEELVNHAIANSDEHIDRSQALQVLGERERLSATGVGSGLGIPHCRLMGIDKPVMVLGRHSNGVDFGSVDNLPCDIFMLMMSCARDPGTHLKLLSAIAFVFNEENVRTAIRDAVNPEEAFEVIKNLALEN